jgi:hypothetical protein
VPDRPTMERKAETLSLYQTMSLFSNGVVGVLRPQQLPGRVVQCFPDPGKGRGLRTPENAENRQNTAGLIRSALRTAPGHLHDARARTYLTPRVDQNAGFTGDLSPLGRSIDAADRSGSGNAFGLAELARTRVANHCRPVNRIVGRRDRRLTIERGIGSAIPPSNGPRGEPIRIGYRFGGADGVLGNDLEEEAQIMRVWNLNAGRYEDRLDRFLDCLLLAPRPFRGQPNGLLPPSGRRRGCRSVRPGHVARASVSRTPEIGRAHV